MNEGKEFSLDAEKEIKNISSLSERIDLINVDRLLIQDELNQKTGFILGSLKDLMSFTKKVLEKHKELVEQFEDISVINSDFKSMLSGMNGMEKELKEKNKILEQQLSDQAEALKITIKSFMDVLESIPTENLDTDLSIRIKHTIFSYSPEKDNVHS